PCSGRRPPRRARARGSRRGRRRTLDRAAARRRPCRARGGAGGSRFRSRLMRVVVTRAAEQAEPLARRLRELGHEVVFCPLIRIEPLGDEQIDCSGYDWVVVTSSNGAGELARRRLGTLPRVAAIGPGTAEALAERGIEPALVATVSTQEGLLAELPRPAGRVLLAA